MNLRKNSKLRLRDASLSNSINPYTGMPYKTEDILSTIPYFDEAGFESLEIAGEKTFYPIIKHNGEDPFERIKSIKSYLKKTPAMMKISGIQLVGMRRFTNCLVEEFIKKTADSGIDIFRIYDPLNKISNLAFSFNQVKKLNKKVDAVLLISSNFNERDIDVLIEKCRAVEKNGADSITIEDHEGFTNPEIVFEIIKTLKDTINIPLSFRSGNSAGTSLISSLMALDGGADSIETCLSSFGISKGSPNPEPFMFLSKDSGAEIDIEKIREINKRTNSLIKRSCVSNIDLINSGPELIKYRATDSVKDHLTIELTELGWEDKIEEGLSLVTEIKKDLGLISFIHPMDRIAVTQTVNNLIFDQGDENYKIVTDQVKAHCLDMNGKLGHEIVKNLPDPLKKIRSSKSLNSDFFNEELQAENEINLSSKKLLEIIYPELKKETDDKNKTKKRSSKSKKFNVHVNNNFYEVEVELADGEDIDVSLVNTETKPEPVKKEDPIPVKEPEPIDEETKEETVKPPKKSTGEIYQVNAPMPGTIFSYNKNEGEEVKKGDQLLIMEAMKMESPIFSDRDGVVINISLNKGDSVSKDDLLMEIA